MTRIVLDPATYQKLHKIAGPFELCDPDGKVFARAVPERHEEFEPSVPQVSQAELDRRAKSTVKGRSTQEVLRRLEP